MSIRETEEYKRMDIYLACSYAEGFCEGEGASEELWLASWQYISDTGLWRQLQGFFGRTVHQLIEEGIIEASVK